MNVENVEKNFGNVEKNYSEKLDFVKNSFHIFPWANVKEQES